MSHDFSFTRTFEVGPLYLEAVVKAEYTPATESSGASVLVIDIEAEDPRVEKNIAGLWSLIVMWLMSTYHDTLEAEGMRHAVLQGLNKYDYRMPPRTKAGDIRIAGRWG